MDQDGEMEISHLETGKLYLQYLFSCVGPCFWEDFRYKKDNCQTFSVKTGVIVSFQPSGKGKKHRGNSLPENWVVLQYYWPGCSLNAPLHHISTR